MTMILIDMHSHLICRDQSKRIRDNEMPTTTTFGLASKTEGSNTNIQLAKWSRVEDPPIQQINESMMILTQMTTEAMILDVHVGNR